MDKMRHEGIALCSRKNALKLMKRLEKNCEVICPFLVGKEAEARKAGKIFMENEVDIVLMYHATYVDDAMSVALIDELKGIFLRLFLSQGLPNIPESVSMIESGICWGVNSLVQLPGSLKRLWSDFNYGFVFGHIENDHAISEIAQYAKAARCVKNLKGKTIAFLPHRSAA